MFLSENFLSVVNPCLVQKRCGHLIRTLVSILACHPNTSTLCPHRSPHPRLCMRAWRPRPGIMIRYIVRSPGRTLPVSIVPYCKQRHKLMTAFDCTLYKPVEEPPDNVYFWWPFRIVRIPENIIYQCCGDFQLAQEYTEGLSLWTS